MKEGLEKRFEVNAGALLRMKPGDRLNFIRGAYQGYEQEIDATLLRAGIEGEGEDKDGIREAFKRRLESHLNQPLSKSAVGEILKDNPPVRFGGDLLAHLPQGFYKFISEREYHLLNAEAAGLAAKIYNTLFPELAYKLYELYGRLTEDARDPRWSDLSGDAHLDIYGPSK